MISGLLSVHFGNPQVLPFSHKRPPKKVSFAILFTYLFAIPFRRGFFCDDESIRHPHKLRVQVSDAVLASIALVSPPIIVVRILEVIYRNLLGRKVGIYLGKPPHVELTGILGPISPSSAGQPHTRLTPWTIRPLKRERLLSSQTVTYGTLESNTQETQSKVEDASFVQFMVLESVRHGLRTPGRYRIFGKTPPQWLVQLGTLSKVFLGGAAFNQITVDVGKYCVGRLRPHFIAVCLPDVLTTCMTSTDHSYITDYLCTGADKDVIQEARYILDLQGRHTGGQVQCVYTALDLQGRHTGGQVQCVATVLDLQGRHTGGQAYLQLNMTWGGSKLLKHTLQFGLILLAWWTALTRVTDYMHHWSDVLAGVGIGTIVSIITVLFVSDITRKRSSADGSELMVFTNKPNSVYVPPSRQEQGVP
uniref:Phosphatidic acid phosphatase type 2/haloperoxidase domain-containing protein n=1 Tax=Timema monikensis TaxID=170555 RepID=A0A7R9HS60_9NEOP|nr:unnamed protein product [Timema monikensis]